MGPILGTCVLVPGLVEVPFGTLHLTLFQTLFLTPFWGPILGSNLGSKKGSKKEVFLR